MYIIRRKGWEIPESQATPEHVFLDRRNLMRGAAIIGAGTILPGLSSLAYAAGDPTEGLYPAKRNETYKLDRDLTPENLASRYNNFYEFGLSKNIFMQAEQLKTRPWMVKIDGLVEKTKEVGIDDLIKAMPLEERVYRHRCVETWSMIVPWSGFPMRSLVELCKPVGDPKFVVMQTLSDTKVMTGQKDPLYPWPYTEGLAMDEAMHDLTFIATGLYGKPIPRQNGAPLRLVAPWKYGFKNVKAIVSLEFTDKRPVSFWEKILPNEYGFWANVNPAVPHPRWSQATEKPLGSSERIPTQIYNGYGEFVAGLYENRKSEKLFM